MAPHQNLTFAFGLLGNVISFMVFLAPLPTFYQIYKKKSTAGFQSLPYVVALFSSMLWIYYALIKMDAKLLITINAVGCIIETIYLSVFLFYATKNARILTVKLLLLLNVLGFGLMLLLTLFLAKGSQRLQIIGWICLVFNLCVFAAPLCIMRQVIRTKSVEYMPFPLSFFLTLGAVMWFFYGFLLKDYYIALPNTVGFIFGIVQMSLYAFYKNANKMILEEPKLQQLSEQIIDVVKLGTIGCPELNPVAALINVNGNDHANGDISEKEKAEEPNKRKDDNSAVNL